MMKGESEYESKRVRNLRKRKERYERELTKASEGTEWFYKNQIALAEYDIEDAVKSEAKRQARLALKQISQKLKEIKELRKRATTVLYDDEVLGWVDRTDFKEECEKRFDLSKILFDRR